MGDKKCTVCNTKIDEDNYKKVEIYVGTVTITLEKKYNRNTFFWNDINKIERKVVNSVKNKSNNKMTTNVVESRNNRTLVIRFSNIGKSYLMNHNPHQKYEPVLKITKSWNQNPNIKAQTSNEIDPIGNYENSTVVFDDMLL